MNAIDALENLAKTSLVNVNLRYCLADEEKHPHCVDGRLAKPNNEEDFVSFEELLEANDLDKYRGVGISVKASQICAIDVDHCFSEPFDINTIDERGKEVIELFKDLAYIEFSFSGTGLRVIFRHPCLDNYKEIYYIKNSKNQIEYYQYSDSIRYVTLTGRSIYDNVDISHEVEFWDVLMTFLNKFMKRPKRLSKRLLKAMEEDDTPIEELMKKVKILYFKNSTFQNLWFKKAPGSGRDESESDFALINMIYNNLTKDKDKVKLIFESSPYFKSKDRKHINKWNYGNFRYYDVIWNGIEG